MPGLLDDELEVGLVALDVPAEADEAVIGQRLEDLAGRVPHPRVHRAGAVADDRLDVVLALVGGAELLVGQHEDVFERVPVAAVLEEQSLAHATLPATPSAPGNRTVG